LRDAVAIGLQDEIELLQQKVANGDVVADRRLTSEPRPDTEAYLKA